MPFRSFIMYLADGTSIRVPHPDFIAMPSAGRTVSVYAENERTHSVIDLLLVTKLETTESSQNAS
ncbi:MAG: hypothetical protein H0W43_01395 [Chthoniobacterales bacterium]|nr:hypothetical protein [Chthoniobacterales bacterium]